MYAPNVNSPSLALSAALASVTYGIKRQRTPPTPCTSNAHEATNAALLPLTLDQARSAFRHSPVTQEVFGRGVVEHYAHLAQLELDHHRGIVTDAEQARWFTRA
ncbi:hypothetical protein [Streptomyces sp. NPDC048428]|uniref:hypothetical protein n=1 Tax=Streptomyces sp. NPDC048428 TaxID=3154503 RepID=UPI003441B7F3